MPIFKEIQKRERIATRDGYGRALVELGEENKDVVVLSGDLTESMRVHWFREKFPKRFIEVGVAEQNMMGIAAGLALAGKIPFASSFAVFSPGRNWDQLRVSVCYNEANVKIAGGHAGITTGEDGATHQALEDIAITRVLPNLRVIVPCDFEETKKATKKSVAIKGPVYIRMGREKVPQVTTKEDRFEFGRAEILKEGDDVTIVACGRMVYEALRASEELKKEKISVMVVNSHTIKPLDAKTIINSARRTGLVVTAEEHQINAGLGGAVAEVLSENYPVLAKRIGVLDAFGESGAPDLLMQKYRITWKDIARKIKESMPYKYKGLCADQHEVHSSLTRQEPQIKPGYFLGIPQLFKK